MRFLVTSFLGVFSAVAGILTVVKDRGGMLSTVQLVVSELPWVTGLVGAVAVIWSLIGKPKLWFGAITGSIGLVLAAKPLMDYRATVVDAASAMRTGLGKDYEAEIPPVVRHRLLPVTAALPNLVGSHLRAARARVWRDIVYATPNGKPLKLDVYEPMTKPVMGQSYPAIIVIHGGGWRNGDKQEYFEPNSRYLANLGYVVFDIQYRLSGTALWPAQLEDAQTAIQWVRDCAGEYNVDPRRIALLGRSAGAHIALMAALKADAATQVQAVIGFYTPTDIKYENLTNASPVYDMLGGPWEKLRDEYTAANPVDQPFGKLPPMFVVEGMMDTIVPYTDGDQLSQRLTMSENRFVHIRIPWARHGFDAVTFGLGAQLAQYHLDRFLAHTFFGEQ